MPTTELSNQAVHDAAQTLGCEVAALRAVIEIETSGSGFFSDGRVKILYEAHVFYRASGGKGTDVVDDRGKAISVPRWDRTLYGPTGDHQWDRHDLAAEVDPVAADKACSWGLGQILGEGYETAGYDDLDTFVADMKESSDYQLDAMVTFIQNKGLDTALQTSPPDWETFAHGYNGPSYKTNQYDTKLAQSYQKWSARPEV